MNDLKTKANTATIIGMFLAIFVIQMLNYFVGAVLEMDVPMGRLVFGVSVFGALGIYYNRNRLWHTIARTPLVLPYCIYIVISFVYGLWRYKSITVSVFDLWLFLFLPAILLIPPFSFKNRIFDKVVALCVIFSSVSVALVTIVSPEVLYDREIFSKLVAPLSVIGAGAPYLLLKYANRVGFYTFVGLIGVLIDGLIYGVVGAFRGRLIMSALVISLFLIVNLISKKVGFGWKFVVIITLAISCLIISIVATTRFDEQLINVSDRFALLGTAYSKTGDIFASDSRLMEFEYFMQLNPSKKLILGHGVGGLWYDFYGMFDEKNTGEGMAGARTLLHMNWLHLSFKIGIVGLFLLVAMLYRHLKRLKIFLKGNPSWWAFVIYYLAWTTYYGDKELGFRSIIFLVVLIHPWVFRDEFSAYSLTNWKTKKIKPGFMLR